MAMGEPSKDRIPDTLARRVSIEKKDDGVHYVVAGPEAAPPLLSAAWSVGNCVLP